MQGSPIQHGKRKTHDVSQVEIKGVEIKAYSLREDYFREDRLRISGSGIGGGICTLPRLICDAWVVFEGRAKCAPYFEGVVN